jgi:hypothetical protein
MVNILEITLEIAKQYLTIAGYRRHDGRIKKRQWQIKLLAIL